MRSFILVFFLISCQNAIQKKENTLITKEQVIKVINPIVNNTYTMVLPTNYSEIGKNINYFDKDELKYLENTGFNLKNDAEYAALGKFKFSTLENFDFILLSEASKNDGLFHRVYLLIFDKDGALNDLLFLGEESNNMDINYTILPEGIIKQIKIEFEGKINDNREIPSTVTKRKFNITDKGKFNMLESKEPYSTILKVGGKDNLIIEY